jgi:para-aminobenzoate synthetase
MPSRAVTSLLIDNYDSFTWNLFQLLAAINGAPPIVVRNDEATWADLRGMAFDNVVLSPGPGTPAVPRDVGVCADAVRDPVAPTLGVCLGHQTIGHVHGARVTRAAEAVHGRVSRILHDGRGLFAEIPPGFEAVRYHSLVLDPELPPCLKRTAWTEDGSVMGVRHRDLPLWGIQFHPESIRTEFGARLLESFRDLTLRARSFSPSLRSPPRPSPPCPLSHEGRGGDRSSLVVRSRRIPSSPDPEHVFLSLFADARSAFWLDGGRAPGSVARFSYMGDDTGPLARLVSYDVGAREVCVERRGNVERRSESIYDHLERELASARPAVTPDLPFDFHGGFVGYFGYELAAELTKDPTPRCDQPAASFLFADRFVAFDHETGDAWAVCLTTRDATGDADAWLEATCARVHALRDSSPPSPPPARARSVSFHLERPRARYVADVTRCMELIAEGQTYEACLTNRIHASVEDALDFYRVLRRDNPAPYAAYLRLGSVRIASSSPERFLRVERDGSVESRPIKGTRPRGRSAAEDDALRADLASRENLMIVDLLRNDLGAVCEIGSVHVPDMMRVETYPTVHQLVSTVRGRLRAGASAVACVRSAFPGGSMTGAPKIRTVRLLRAIEETPRGVYSGALGYLGVAGTANLSIVIRTLVQTPSSTTIGIGGAVVALSDPGEEFEETLVKARALLRAAVRTPQGGATDDATCEEVLGGLRREGRATA